MTHEERLAEAWEGDDTEEIPWYALEQALRHALRDYYQEGVDAERTIDLIDEYLAAFTRAGREK